MNCRDFEANVLALARNELIEAASREISLAHTLNCVWCADRLAGELALFTGVRAVIEELAEEKAPPHIGAVLLTAFREHNAAVTRNTVIPMPTKGVRYWRPEAAAAATLIMVSALAVIWLYSRSPIEKQVALIVPPASVTTHESQSPAVTHDPEIASIPATTRLNKLRHRAARRTAKPTEEVTEFFPLMDGVDLDSLETVQSVRVELPASALMDLGLRASPETTTGLVKADVLLGLDGLARAIRFVR